MRYPLSATQRRSKLSKYEKAMTYDSFKPKLTPLYKEIVDRHKESQLRIARRGQKSEIQV